MIPKDKEFLTDEEISKIETDRAKAWEARGNVDFEEAAKSEGQQGDVDVGYNQFFLDLGTKVNGTKRTSLVIDPPNGRVPAPSEAAVARYVEARDMWRDLLRGRKIETHSICASKGLMLVRI